MTSRRDLLRALAASALLPSLARAALTTPRRTAVPAVGIQLYLARNLMRADAEGTLARIAELGFAEVEWWGQWNRTPTQLRAMLDTHGLRSPSSHVGLRALEPERLPALFETANIMGHTSVIVASLEPQERATADDWKRSAAVLNRAGLAGAAQGVRVGYHNHGYESTMYGDRSGYDILLAETDPTYVDFQLDVYWALSGGMDPLAFLKAHRTRISTLHLKDAARTPNLTQVDLGTGIIDWPTMLREGAAGRVTAMYLDLDDPADVWATAGSARRYLRSLGY
jgi:sugar phosphate isomerase/epimerase